MKNPKEFSRENVFPTVKNIFEPFIDSHVDYNKPALIGLGHMIFWAGTFVILFSAFHLINAIVITFLSLTRMKSTRRRFADIRDRVLNRLQMKLALGPVNTKRPSRSLTQWVPRVNSGDAGRLSRLVATLERMDLPGEFIDHIRSNIHVKFEPIIDHSWFPFALTLLEGYDPGKKTAQSLRYDMTTQTLVLSSIMPDEINVLALVKLAEFSFQRL
jgi:hypothetical protein